MKRIVCIITLSLFVAGPTAWAIPSSITYQGTLKEKGLPASGSRNMSFQLTSLDGSTPYSKAIATVVTVNNGLFSAHLDFQLLSGFTWESITPYLQVSIEGQTLTPREPVSA